MASGLGRAFFRFRKQSKITVPEVQPLEGPCTHISEPKVCQDNVEIKLMNLCFKILEETFIEGNMIMT